MKVAVVDAGAIKTEALLRGNAGLQTPQLENLGIQYIAAIAKNEGYDLCLYLNQGNYGELLKDVLSYNPDLLAISSMTYQFPDALQLANDVKKANKKITTVFGGPHPSGVPSIVKEKVIDYVIMGEGEETFRELLSRLYNDENTSDVKGIAYTSNKEVVINPVRERIKNLDDLPLPVRDREFIANQKGYSLDVIPHSNLRVAVVIYSRGCPYNCYFCPSPSMWGRKIIYRSPDNTIDEVESLVNSYNSNFIVFADLNFSANKSKVKELCEEIQRRELNVAWSCLSTIDVDEDLLRTMKEAGFGKVLYGVESFDAEFLKSMNKRKDPLKAKEIIALTGDIGILTQTFLLIDPRTATEATFQTLLSELRETTPDVILISFLTPFPGTILYEQIKEEGSLLTTDWRRYTMQEPILKGKLSPEDLLKHQKKLVEDYYNSREYVKKAKTNIERRIAPKKSYEEFFSNLRQIGFNV